MKLHIRHTFPFTVEQFWTCWDDPAWEAEEHRGSDMRIEVLDVRHEGDVEVRRQRFHTGISLPAMVAKPLGTDTLSYEQVSRLDRASGQMTWEVIPPAMRDKVVAKGTMTVRPVAGGVEQVVEGEVRVDVPLVGRKIEQGVVDGIQKSHDATAERRLRWMKQRFANS